MFIKESDLKKLKKGSTVEDILSYIADSNEEFAKGIEQSITELATKVSSSIDDLKTDNPEFNEQLARLFTNISTRLMELVEETSKHREHKGREHEDVLKTIREVTTAITNFSKANSIDKKLSGIEQQITERNNSDWEFDIIRDGQNRIQKITTKRRKLK